MSRRFRSRNENGQTMVEFTLVLPILCLLLFGVIQMGIVFHDYITITDATRVGARVAATSRTDPNPVAKATAAVKKSAAGINTAKLGTTVVSTWAIGSEVTVTATYPYDVSLLGFVVASGNLSSRTTERVEP
jgi:Flp pilus assembly protein TadG